MASVLIAPPVHLERELHQRRLQPVHRPQCGWRGVEARLVVDGREHLVEEVAAGPCRAGSVAGLSARPAGAAHYRDRDSGHLVQDPSVDHPPRSWRLSSTRKIEHLRIGHCLSSPTVPIHPTEAGCAQYGVIVFHCLSHQVGTAYRFRRSEPVRAFSGHPLGGGPSNPNGSLTGTCRRGPRVSAASPPNHPGRSPLRACAARVTAGAVRLGNESLAA